MKRAFGAAALVVLLSFALPSFGDDDPEPRAKTMDLDFHKKVPRSRLRIELAPAATVTRTHKKGLVLSLKVTNASSDDVKTTLAHEWHGGEWPPTALYASVTPQKDNKKQPRAFAPAYLAGEDQGAAPRVTLAAGKATDLELRMDWPGTGSCPAEPLIGKPGKYAVRFLLVFEADGKEQFVLTSAKVVEYVAK